MSVAAWEPRVALSAAEESVDFPAHEAVIAAERQAVEEASTRAAISLALAVAELETAVPSAAVERLAASLGRALERTLRFGFREAQREVRELRSRRAAQAAVELPRDVGDYGETALQGRESVRQHVLRRSRAASQAISAEVLVAARTPGLTSVEREALLLDTARRALHSSVLELVGETLNMGRTAGALALPSPPEFALRSEQLDKRTCDPCSRLHGEIAALGSPEYFALLPPTGCLGGGRCRGIMVFGDGPLDLRLPQAA